MSSSKKIFKFKIWIPLFFIFLCLIPTLLIFNQTNWAKLIGILVVITFTIAVRRWLFQIKKLKKSLNRIPLNTNDKFWLNDTIAFYRNLIPSDKIIFENRIGLFLSDVKITEIGKEVPEKETCLYVAASAIITFWGLPYWNYGELNEVLVYPENFNPDNSLSKKGLVQGKVHHGGLMNNTMIISLPSLIFGFKNETDKKNLGIHEFAHMLDKASGNIDGIPFGMSEEDRKTWIHLCSEEVKKIMKGKSDINSYSTKNLPEFFAVTVEYYKEQPKTFQKKYPELFEVLENYFN
jgi:MtfA peptidase